LGLLVALSAIVIALYTVMSACGLWLADQVRRARRSGRAMPETLADLPPHHIDLLAGYGAGMRSRIWQLSIIALLASLLALASGHQAAAWFFGLALLADSMLFLTFSGRGAYVARASALERLADAASCLVLLAALAILVWRVGNGLE
jgi:hypothetical protein